MGESETEFRCDICNAAYGNRGTALECCSDLFGKRDAIRTDGGTGVVGDVERRPQPSSLQEVLEIDPSAWELVERAASEGEYSGPEAFVREAAMRLVDDVLDEDGPFECPHDDCDRTFATRRQLRGHLGSSEHGLDVPDGAFWCGYCGHGPMSWRGVNAHHGSTDHEGEPVRLEAEPDRDDLIAPEELADHRDPELLEQLYRRHGGNYSEMCRNHDFDVSPGRVRHYLIEFDIHEPTPQGSGGELGVKYDRMELEQMYERNCGNISAMYRSMDDDVPYRTLHKTLKRIGIHDPTSSAPAHTPDRSPTHGNTGQVDDTNGTPLPSDDSVDDPASSESAFADLPVPEWLDEATFHAAVEESSGMISLMDALDWRELGKLESVLDQLELWEQLEAGGGG